jgi:hypothetical protein
MTTKESRAAPVPLARDSGAPWELIKEFEVSAEHIAKKAVELMDVKRAGPGREEQLVAGLRER